MEQTNLPPKIEKQIGAGDAEPPTYHEPTE